MNNYDREKVIMRNYGGIPSSHDKDIVRDLSKLNGYGKKINSNEIEDNPGFLTNICKSKYLVPIIGGLFAIAATSGCIDKDNNSSDNDNISNKTIPMDYPNTDVDKTKVNDKNAVSDSLSKDEFSKDFYSSLNKGDNITLMTSRGEITGKVKDLISSDYRFAIKINGPDGSYVRMIDTFESDKHMNSLISDKYKKYNVKNLVIERFDIDKDFKFDLLRSYINLKQNRNGTIDYGSGMELFDGKDNNFKRLTPSLLFKACSSEYGDDPGEKHGLTPQDKIKRGCKITE